MVPENSETKNRGVSVEHRGVCVEYWDVTHIAQNITETCQKYFQSFIAIEILPQHFCQLFQNISLQDHNFNFLKYFRK